jgi:hypothetical protein
MNGLDLSYMEWRRAERRKRLIAIAATVVKYLAVTAVLVVLALSCGCGS